MNGPTVSHTVWLLPLVTVTQLYAPGRIRTSDQQLRRLLLYPPELRAPRPNLTLPCPGAHGSQLEPWRYTSAVLPISPGPVALRVVALALAIAVGSSATGLPMCLSLLAQAATPCHMHRAHHGSAMHQRGAPIAALVPQRADQACPRSTASSLNSVGQSD